MAIRFRRQLELPMPRERSLGFGAVTIPAGSFSNPNLQPAGSGFLPTMINPFPGVGFQPAINQLDPSVYSNTVGYPLQTGYPFNSNNLQQGYPIVARAGHLPTTSAAANYAVPADSALVKAAYQKLVSDRMNQPPVTYLTSPSDHSANAGTFGTPNRTPVSVQKDIPAQSPLDLPATMINSFPMDNESAASSPANIGVVSVDLPGATNMTTPFPDTNTPTAAVHPQHLLAAKRPKAKKHINRNGDTTLHSNNS
ncbi:uncharacterized protein LOC129584094 [Paramacrobiotus metropolitanus]|uniref:uncharacterized protein LOC129584094 n=1 Tax=Paramacrobiotus metropolitanus TaxID=2943436 RepID=UPI002445C539|nr:uncharacterized protein LOC129584094 [Paramacrobiotus metropolitanus]